VLAPLRIRASLCWLVKVSVQRLDFSRCTDTLTSQHSPKVRNGHSVRTLNTLIYIVVNVQALARVRRAKARAPTLVLC